MILFSFTSKDIRASKPSIFKNNLKHTVWQCKSQLVQKQPGSPHIKQITEKKKSELKKYLVLNLTLTVCIVFLFQEKGFMKCRPLQPGRSPGWYALQISQNHAPWQLVQRLRAWIWIFGLVCISKAKPPNCILDNPMPVQVSSKHSPGLIKRFPSLQTFWQTRQMFTLSK